MTENYNLPQMMTIREIARTGVLPENALRMFVKQNKIPYISVNKKVLINFRVLCDILNNPASELCS